MRYRFTFFSGVSTRMQNQVLKATINAQFGGPSKDIFTCEYSSLTGQDYKYNIIWVYETILVNIENSSQILDSLTTNKLKFGEMVNALL